MGKLDKIMFTIFTIVVQLIQFLAVYFVAWCNSHVIEFIVIFLSFQFNRKIFGTSYHADKLSKCTLLTLGVFYFLIKGVPALGVSLFLPPLFGVYLSFALNYINSLIENQQVPEPFVKKKLREQILNILGDNLTEEGINELCLRKGIHPRVAETVFLYLTNSKDDVADILDIQGTTVIRRLKKFIEKTT